MEASGRSSATSVGSVDSDGFGVQPADPFSQLTTFDEDEEELSIGNAFYNYLVKSAEFGNIVNVEQYKNLLVKRSQECDFTAENIIDNQAKFKNRENFTIWNAVFRACNRLDLQLLSVDHQSKIRIFKNIENSKDLESIFENFKNITQELKPIIDKEIEIIPKQGNVEYELQRAKDDFAQKILLCLEKFLPSTDKQHKDEAEVPTGLASVDCNGAGAAVGGPAA